MKFIKVYNNVASDEYCEKVIETFDIADNLGLVWERNSKIIDRQRDLSLPFNPTHNKEMDFRQQEISNEFFSLIKESIERYISDLHIMDVSPWYFRNMAVQKSNHENLGGYHIWHYEGSNAAYNDRWLTYTLYLNDIPEGEGETEFFYQGYRYQPKRGDVVVFPAGFTHTHRGNPVTTTTKYIATGWVFMMEQS